MIGQVSKGMPERGQFPIQNRDHVGSLAVKHDVVQTIIPMHDGGLPIILHHVAVQPIYSPIHIGTCLCFTGAILPCPTRDLPRKIIARLAKVSQSDGLWINIMQGGQGPH